MTDLPELQKASLPPHSQLPSIPSHTNAPGRIFEELVMDPNAPFDIYSFKQTGYLSVAMESQAEVWDVFPGSSITRYFDGTAELHAISQPTALMHLDSFEIAFQSSDPTCAVK
ncbi:hypothetical protein FRC06_008010 [Ceratobasidium sp. 370]|nr:hypothetical protein FRC06_008010 [Ceratobasidium sp. 370]